MREMILLGAGASVEAGVPTTYEMTRKILDTIEGARRESKHTNLLKFVIGGLIFKQTCEGKNPFTGINVEDVFNAMELLSNRNLLEASAFIGSWHPLIEEFDSIVQEPNRYDVTALERALRKSVLDSLNRSAGKTLNSIKIRDIDNSIQKSLKNLHSFRSPGRLICDCITDTFKKASAEFPFVNYSFREKFSRATVRKMLPGRGDIFYDTQELMIRKLVDLVLVKDESKVAYLKPLIYSVAHSQQNMSIATLNYDNTIELAAKSSNVSVDTGIQSWIKKGDLNPIGDVILYKIHGSINWELTENQKSEDSPLPHDSLIVKSDIVEGKDFKPAIIFGGKNKLTAKGPFLEILRKFQENLNKAEILTVIGHSFQDQHVNEIITKWLNDDSFRKIRIVNGPNFLPRKISFTLGLIMHIDKRVNIIQKKASEAIEMLYDNNQFL